MNSRGRRVLVVDDDADILESIEMVLAGAGYEVATARNGLDALERLREQPATCLILLDLMMPVMNGWEFRHEQLEDSKLAGIPTVIVTAHNRPVQNAQELKVKHVIPKPVQPDLLLSTVSAYCR